MIRRRRDDSRDTYLSLDVWTAAAEWSMAAVQDDGAPSRCWWPSGMAATTTATIGRRIMSIMTSTCRPSSHRCLDGVCGCFRGSLLHPAEKRTARLFWHPVRECVRERLYVCVRARARVCVCEYFPVTSPRKRVCVREVSKCV